MAVSIDQVKIAIGGTATVEFDDAPAAGNILVCILQMDSATTLGWSYSYNGWRLAASGSPSASGGNLVRPHLLFKKLFNSSGPFPGNPVQTVTSEAATKYCTTIFDISGLPMTGPSATLPGLSAVDGQERATTAAYDASASTKLSLTHSLGNNTMMLWSMAPNTATTPIVSVGGGASPSIQKTGTHTLASPGRSVSAGYCMIDDSAAAGSITLSFDWGGFTGVNGGIMAKFLISEIGSGEDFDTPASGENLTAEVLRPGLLGSIFRYTTIKE